MLSVGIPKEIKSCEKRVALIPEHVKALCALGITVRVEKNAGLASGFADREYERSGAVMTPAIRELYDRSEIIQKVKEPVSEEFAYFRPDHLLFCFLHLASPANCGLVKMLQEKKVTAIGYETLAKDGRMPILAPMSEIAGGLSAAYAAFFKRSIQVQDGKIVYAHGFQAQLETLANLYPKPPDFLRADRTAVIFGGGVAGRKAAEVLLALGGHVTVIEKNAEIRERLQLQYAGSEKDFRVLSPEASFQSDLEKAEILIGCVHLPGYRAAQMLTLPELEEISRVQKKIMMDVAIDQGGNFPEARPTSYDEPFYLDRFGNLRFAVSNIPSLCGHGASKAISEISWPYTGALAENPREAFERYPELLTAVNLQAGKILIPAIREAHQL